MQAYVILMIIAVVAGTLFDVYHKRSGEYFFLRKKKSEAAARRRLGAGERASLALQTLGKEVATAGEFCKWERRVSHLLVAYGFVIYLITTIMMVFVYPTAEHTPGVLTALWTLGALMVLVGGLWFFFLLRANVAYEGNSPFSLIYADLFIGSLLASVASGLIWHYVQTLPDSEVAALVWFGVYIFFTTLLFVSVPWSKFAHMFYKPMAAYQKRVEEAEGSSDLPRPAEGSFIKR
jgi:hypothetical protein